MFRRKFSVTASGISSACGDAVICIDNTQGFDGIRYYHDFVPTLRSKRSELKVALPAVLKYQRTEYAKKIRKDYEVGRIKERRCNMREYTVRTDGISNTVTTVQKDNYVVVNDVENF